MMREENRPPATSAPELKKTDVFYSIQVKSSPKELKIDPNNFSGLKGVEMYRHEGLFKYRVGKLQDLDKAFDLLDDVKKKGYRDAFVIAFRGTERITVMKAQELLGQ